MQGEPIDFEQAASAVVLRRHLSAVRDLRTRAFRRDDLPRGIVAGHMSIGGELRRAFGESHVFIAAASLTDDEVDVAAEWCEREMDGARPVTWLTRASLDRLARSLGSA